MIRGGFQDNIMSTAVTIMSFNYMKELQLQALILHGPFARSLDTSRPEQQFLTSKLGHGALIALFQTVGKGEACSTVAMARLSWYFKKKTSPKHTAEASQWGIAQTASAELKTAS